MDALHLEGRGTLQPGEPFHFDAHVRLVGQVISWTAAVRYRDDVFNLTRESPCVGEPASRGLFHEEVERAVQRCVDAL